MSITTFSPEGIILLIVIGTFICFNSSFAKIIGSNTSFGCLMSSGAPRDICKDLAPIILATSNLVNSSFGHTGIQSPLKVGTLISF